MKQSPKGNLNPETREIEITPEMIEAGAKIVWEIFDEVISWGSETGRDVARRAYLAMGSLDPERSGRNEDSPHK